MELDNLPPDVGPWHGLYVTESSPPANRWWPFLLPLLVFTLLGSLEPKPASQAPAAPSSEATLSDASTAPPALSSSDHRYARFYALRIALTAAALVLAAPAYRRFPWRITWLGVAVGVVGAGLWIGLQRLHLEEALLAALGRGDWAHASQRTAFDPFAAFQGDGLGLATFLTVRFVGLVLVVPLIEEFFLRGFLMRFVVRDPWWKVPFGEVTLAAVVVAIVYAVATHPAEWIAAAAWFSLVTWLMHQTRSIGECVVAHAATNLLLGLYVVTWGEWWLW